MAIPISSEKVSDLVSFCKDEGTFFTVGFLKRSDGSYREINCRGRVCKDLKGGSLPYSPSEKELIVIWDVKDGKYKTIPLDTIQIIKAHHQIYEVM